MAVLLKFYFAPAARRSAVMRREFRPAIEFAELARRVRSAAAELAVFLWASLALAFFGLVASGFLFE
jgi:hypothetical protein